MWLDLMGSTVEIALRLKEFVALNSGTASVGVVWDTLKAFLRGLLHQQVVKIKNKSRELEARARKEVMKSEAQYVKDPTPEKHEIWLKRQQEYKEVINRKTENKRLFQRQNYFGEGEKTGRMLALLVKCHTSPPAISSIRTTSGEITFEPTAVLEAFSTFYRDLYRSHQRSDRRDMDRFLEGVDLPVLSEVERREMESPLTLEELQRAVAELSGKKSPGPDGLPLEIYKQYGEVLLPELLEVLEWAVKEGRLPSSMTEANIVVIPKEGKDQSEVSSYRPISLLCSDVKIIARALASRLNKCIAKLVHLDQSGFIPGRSTSTNIRRAYLNLQVPTENTGSRAILSLDTAKAFDSLEWEYFWWSLQRFGFGPVFIRWVKLLYNRPSARLKINNGYSERFLLERGTRQGCPLSPLLFALAMEPLAEVVRASAELRGFQRKWGKERIALYADDVLFFPGRYGILLGKSDAHS